MQNYADRDPSPKAADYACGGETYDGHDGTDIRIRDTASRADVIAAAAGVVKAVRDGMADRLVSTPADSEAVKSRECGNGAVIDHGDGWQTQYCHMRQGSIAVRAGDRVAAGAKLGAVGYSGLAAFPHVHLSVRKDGKSLDPFRTADADGKSCGAMAAPLWSPAARAVLAYQRGALLDAGFTPQPVAMADLGAANIERVAPSSSWPALVFHVWAINLEAGDALTVTLDGPDGITAQNSVTLDRNKAEYMLFAGRKRPVGGWPSGLYRGRLSLVRDGSEFLSRSVDVQLP
ncbi:MAG: M23 family metallopeptidase [Rhizobiales bacterium]|nr:M23 family metallopeptidase [Hyphomicrobiales bacterium]